jgi:hypothetical protein
MMKTHDVAKALTALAKVLRALPNQSIEDFGDMAKPRQEEQVSSIGFSLSTLAGFSKYEKSDWEKVIHEFNLPIQIRPRDAARDVMGKILSYLAENQKERERLARPVSGDSSDSSELSVALRFLLGNG